MRLSCTLEPRATSLTICAVVPMAASMTPRDAHALKSNFHYDMTRAACRAQDLPRVFCERLARESVNVDSVDWDVLHLHAMPNDDQDSCAGANDVLAETSRLLVRVRETVPALSSEPGFSDRDAVIQALGRAMHVLQDNCSHAGVADRQHAWQALTYTCENQGGDPDTDPTAVSEATEDTEQALATLADWLRSNDVDTGLLEPSPVAPPFPPPRAGVCEYYAKAPLWDGVDTRWNKDGMRTRLREQWKHALQGGGTSPLTVCGADGPDIRNATPGEPVDTTVEAPTCLAATLPCPSFLAQAPLLDDEPLETVGCSASTLRSDLMGIASLALALLVRRRRTP